MTVSCTHRTPVDDSTPGSLVSNMPDTTDPALSTNEPSKPSLLTIPLELRDIIYDLVFQSTTITMCGEVFRALPPKLPAVCKQMRNETRAVARAGYTDWYHRPGLRDEIMADFWDADKGLLGDFMPWSAVIETPLHKKYTMAQLRGVFSYRKTKYECMTCVVYGVEKRDDEPTPIIAFFGGHNPTFKLWPHDAGAEQARLVAEAILRLEGQVTDLWRVAAFKRRALRRLLRHITQHQLIAERDMLEELKAEMADARCLAGMMQLTTQQGEAAK